MIGIKQNGDDIVFTFNQLPLKQDVSYFVLGDGTNNRYVFDIKATRLNSVKPISVAGVKETRIAQFNKETLRVVFENAQKLDISYKISNENLIVNIKGIKNSVQTPNTTVIDKNVTTKNATVDKNTTNKNTTTVQVPNTTTKNATTDKNATDKNVTVVKVVPVGHGKTIVIDPGHGGKDAGAVYEKLYEKDAVLQIGKFLGDELKKRGYTVHFTRDKDVYLQLRTRTEIANNKNADMFISVHVNAAPKKSQSDVFKGVETYFLSKAKSDRSISVAELENKSDMEDMDFYSKQTFLNFLNREKIIASHKLAIDIQSFTLSSIKTKHKDTVDGGVREAPFWVLVGAQMPAVLFEAGYITDEKERVRIFSKEYQQLLAVGMANGVDAYFAKNK